MKTLCLLATTLTVSLLAAVAVAQDGQNQNEPNRDPPLCGQPVEGLRLSLRSAQSRYVVGDKLEVQMVVQNVDAQDHEIVLADPLFIFAFEVKAPDGKTLPLNKRGKQIRETVNEVGKRASHLLKSKDEAAFGMEMSEIYDLQSPGEYTVTASMKVQQQKDESKWSKLTSNPLTITIAEKDK